MFNASSRQTWDGMAQLHFDKPLPMPKQAHGEPAQGMFQMLAEPYLPWATVRYRFMDSDIDCHPNPLQSPWPATRTGFYKQCFLVAARSGVDFEAMFDHWLNVHVPNVMNTMRQADGLRYNLSLSIDPLNAPYAGLAELYFGSRDDWVRYRDLITADGLETYVNDEASFYVGCETEMIGIPEAVA